MEKINLNSIKDVKRIGNIALTIGAFDGIHQGHLELIAELKKQANKDNYQTAVVTFDIHPDYLLKKRKNLGVINTISEKEKIFNDLGIDYLIFLHTINFLNLDYQKFDEMIKKLGTKLVLVGEDFCYGFKGLGNYKTLSLNFNTILFQDVKYHNKKISSSDLREYLSKGMVEEILKISNNPFVIQGIVLRGSRVGRTLGFPTANIDLGEKYLDLKFGVYAVKVQIENDDKLYLGLANVGNNPTINTIKKPRIEVFIMDFNGDIYDKELTISFLKYLREEKKFNNKEELIEAIEKNVLEARNL